MKKIILVFVYAGIDVKVFDNYNDAFNANCDLLKELFIRKTNQPWPPSFYELDNIKRNIIDKTPEEAVELINNWVDYTYIDWLYEELPLFLIKEIDV